MLIKITPEKDAKKIICICSKLLEIEEAFPKQYLFLPVIGAMIFNFTCFVGIDSKTASFCVAKTGFKLANLPE